MKLVDTIIKSSLKFLNKLPGDKAKNSFYITLTYIILLYVLTPLVYSLSLVKDVAIYDADNIAALLSFFSVTLLAAAKELYDKRSKNERRIEIGNIILGLLLSLAITIYIIAFCRG